MTHTCTKHEPGSRHCHTGHGCACRACLDASYLYSKRSRLRAVRGEGNQPPHGVRRRLQALMRRGWSLTELGRRLGRSKSAMTDLLTGVTYVQWATHTAVVALYDELWDRQPDRSTPDARRAATRAQRRAERQGWPPPAAWDDGYGPHGIDNPDATPVGVRRNERQSARSTDVLELAELGTPAHEIAARLGLGIRSVERALQRAGRGELWTACRPRSLDQRTERAA